MTTVTIHDGAGNDFLVALADPRLGPAAARALCDRSSGLGADGLLVLDHGSTTDLTMVLWNADGSRAEMSGNGIRCLVHGAIVRGLVEVGTVSVATDAGVKVVEVTAADATSTWSSVDMGAVTLGDVVELPESLAARRASVGNPHLVVVVENASQLDPSVDGPSLAAGTAEGTNVEWITPRADGSLDLVVYERGVGPTKACGTGSCAAAVVAHDLGLVGTSVAVHNPGGILRVEVVDRGHVILAGPTVLRETVDVDLDVVGQR